MGSIEAKSVPLYRIPWVMRKPSFVYEAAEPNCNTVKLGLKAKLKFNNMNKFRILFINAAIPCFQFWIEISPDIFWNSQQHPF